MFSLPKKFFSGLKIDNFSYFKEKSYKIKNPEGEKVPFLRLGWAGHLRFLNLNVLRNATSYFFN